MIPRCFTPRPRRVPVSLTLHVPASARRARLVPQQQQRQPRRTITTTPGKVDGVALQLMHQAMATVTASGARSGAHAHGFHSTARRPAARVVKPFLLADIGEGITECEIVKWNVEVGQVVDEFDPIVEVMSDKATVEISSPFAGKVVSLNGAPGDVVRVGKNLCEIEMEGEESGEGSGQQPVKETAQTASLPPTAPPAPTAEIPGSSSTSEASSSPEVHSEQTRRRAKTEIHASPATRRVAREHRVDLANVTGTGPQGRVTKGDVLEYLAGGKSSTATTEQSKPAAAAAPVASTSSPSPTQMIPLSSVRKAMYRGMTATLSIPHFSYSETLDVTELERLRLQLNANIPLTRRKTLTGAEEATLERLQEWGTDSSRVPESHRYDRMTLLPLLIKALDRAMAWNPLFACSLQTSPEPTLVRRQSHDISIALSAPTGGLYTPLLPAVEKESPYSLASSISGLLHASQASSPPKFADANKGSGSITLSNVGVVGGTTTHPIIPPTGQLAIGALGRMRVEPRYVDPARAKKVAQGLEDTTVELKTEPRLLMDVTFSADHRVVEGVELAKLVEAWKRLIEQPALLAGL